ncbi:nucleoside hydrolase [Nitrospira sp. Nam74]
MISLWSIHIPLTLTMAFAMIGFSAVLSLAENDLSKTSVWIDTDPSVMPGGHEVDDGFALIQAFHSPELRVRGVSVVFGNAALHEALPIAEELVRRFGPPELPVYSGADGPQAFGHETPASRALVAALRREPMTVVALGPVTNVATVIMRHPEVVPKIKRIVAVAGRRPGQRFLAGPKQERPFRDFNFELDPEAFQVLLDSRVPVVLTPWEISSRVWIKKPDIADMVAANPALAWLAQATLDWLTLWQNRFGADGFNPFDTLAIGVVTSPSWFECDRLRMEIAHLPDDDASSGVGEASRKPYLLTSTQEASKLVTYCYRVSPVFTRDLLLRLTTSK